MIYWHLRAQFNMPGLQFVISDSCPRELPHALPLNSPPLTENVPPGIGLPKDGGLDQPSPDRDYNDYSHTLTRLLYFP